MINNNCLHTLIPAHYSFSFFFSLHVLIRFACLICLSICYVFFLFKIFAFILDMCRLDYGDSVVIFKRFSIALLAVSSVHGRWVNVFIYRSKMGQRWRMMYINRLVNQMVNTQFKKKKIHNFSVSRSKRDVCVCVFARISVMICKNQSIKFWCI